MRPLTLALPLALAVAVLSQPAAADGIRPYLRATAGIDWSGDTTFKDANCNAVDPYALFGCGKGEDGKPIGARGDFGNSTLLGLGAGLELTRWFRVEAALDVRPNLQFDGNANFVRAGKDQPVRGSLTQADLMAFAYIDPLAAMGVESRWQPFLGLGAGVSRNDIGSMTYEFPELKQPRYSVMPGGTNYDFAWSATAGLGYQVSDNVTLELAYRYSDLGKVETDVGELYNVTSRSARYIPIAKTEADLTTQSVTVSARFGF
jgi:opacity protein-like surface antigen